MVGRGGEEFFVDCGRCKQGISGESLGLGREKMKKMNFTCRACVEGEKLEQEVREGKNKAMDVANKQVGEKEGERGGKRG